MQKRVLPYFEVDQLNLGASEKSIRETRIENLGSWRPNSTAEPRENTCLSQLPFAWKAVRFESSVLLQLAPAFADPSFINSLLSSRSELVDV